MSVSNWSELVSGLPGEELIREGITDAQRGRQTVAALLVATAAHRLEACLGALPFAARPPRPEPQLYELLWATHGVEAYGQYNALLNRLTSFCRALEARTHRQSLARSA